MPGTLYLIPTPLVDTRLEQVLPEETRRITAGLSTFIVEHPKTARAFLKQVGSPTMRLDIVQNEPASFGVSQNCPRSPTRLATIMDRMAREGHIDPDIYAAFVGQGIHLAYAREFLLPEQIDV